MAFYSVTRLLLFVFLGFYIQDRILLSPVHKSTDVVEFDLNGLNNTENDPSMDRSRVCTTIYNPGEKPMVHFLMMPPSSSQRKAASEKPRKQSCTDVMLSPREKQNARAYTKYLRGLNNHFWQKGLLNRTSVISTSGFHEILAVVMHMAKENSPSKRELEQALGHFSLEPAIITQIRDYLETLQVASSTAFYLPNPDILPENIREDMQNMNIVFKNSLDELNEFVVTKSKGHSNLQKDHFEEGDPTLVNVISFQLTWQHKVTYKRENLLPFYLKDSTAIQVPMMKIDAEMEWYVKEHHYFVVKLPFQKEIKNSAMKLNGLAAYVIGQENDIPVPEVSRDFINEVLEGMRSGFKSEIILRMPAIKLQAESKLTTNEFSALLESPNKDFVLNVDEFEWAIRQEAFLCMDDKGTVGGSTTSSRAIMLSAVWTGPPQFTVDHPYIILLALEETLEPIFVAKVDRVSTEIIACTRN